MPEETPAPGISEQLLLAQNYICERVDSTAPLEAVLRALAAFVDSRIPAGRCSIFLADPKGLVLHVGTATSGQGARPCRSSPIVSAAGSALGIVSVDYEAGHAPREEEIAYLTAAAQLAAHAVETSRQSQSRGAQAPQERFRALIENTSDIISILDQDGIIRYVSPSMERVLGFPPSALLGTSGFDCFHPDDLARARRAFAEVLSRPGCPLAIEQRFRHADGSWRVIETIANNRTNDPAIGGVVVTGHDVTDRKQAEDKLIASQERYRELFENANDIIYTHDMAGTLTSLNKAAEAVTGYSREEALGRNILSIVAPEHQQIAREALERKIGGEAKTTYEVDIVSKSGARIPVEVSTRLIFNMGKPVAVQGIARDVTERRRFETHLLQSHKMEAIGRLAGGVAHDFNNMLTVITGYSQWILDELPDESPLVEIAAEILHAANRAAALTNQLLAFSRSQVIQPIIVNLNSLMTELDPMLRRMIGEDIDLVALTSLDLGLVRADPGQIEQVILNLAVNARDAMPGGGKLIIEASNIEIGEEDSEAPIDCPPGSYVTLTVTDSGHGIAPHAKNRIFEPFFTTKETGKGTGLGLSTVYGIVKQGGGHIKVDSEPGAGASFRVYFPRVFDDQPQSVAPKIVVRSRGGETVLLVEDEAAVRRIVGEMLQRLGYTILEAPDGRSAQKFMMEYEKPIQLLLTDVVMPEVGGPELAKRLRSMRAGLKVLFMSGYADDAVVQQDVLEPGSAYLQKPFTLDMLSAKLREVLDSA